MRKIILILTIMFGWLFGNSNNADAQSHQISDIRERNGWYVIFDESGRQMKQVSKYEGEMIGFSSKIFILERNNWYYVYNTNCQKYLTLSKLNIGEITVVTSNGYVSERNGWIYYYDLNGKQVEVKSKSMFN